MIDIKSLIKNLFSVLVLILACICTSVSYADDIAVIANINNQNAQLSQSEAINIFMGRFRQFADGTKAKPIDNDNIKSDFYKQLVNKSASEIKAYWATLIFSGRTLPPKSMKDTENVIKAVNQEIEAISYIPANQINQVNHKVKVLLILKEEK
jgi:ABC-type phosphate transport system substrate-binding protein